MLNSSDYTFKYLEQCFCNVNTQEIPVGRYKGNACVCKRELIFKLITKFLIYGIFLIINIDFVQIQIVLYI